MSDDTEELRRKGFLRDWTKSNERRIRSDARLGERTAEVKRKLRAIRSGKSAKSRRRSVGRDQKIFDGIAAASKDGDVVVITSRAGPTVTDYRAQVRRTRIDTIGPEGEPLKCSTFWTPSWDHSGPALKQLAWGQVMHELGGQVMSVHLGEEVVKEGVRRNSSQPGAFTTYIRDRVADQLRKAFTPLGLTVPPFFFTVETGEGIAPHFHGAIAVSANWVHLAEEALVKAGGTWKERKRQVEIKPTTSAVGWVRYINKWREQSRRALGDPRLVAASSNLRSRAREWYERARRDGLALH